MNIKLRQESALRRPQRKEMEKLLTRGKKSKTTLRKRPQKTTQGARKSKREKGCE